MDKELYKEIKERIANRAKIRRQQNIELRKLIKMDEQKELIRLLELLLRHSGEIEYGMCRLVSLLQIRGIYTERNEEVINNYIDTHKPFHVRLFNLKYWYPKGEKWRRVRLIEKWIRKEKEFAANFTTITTYTHNVL